MIIPPVYGIYAEDGAAQLCRVGHRTTEGRMDQAVGFW
jgi:hypothetical protein